MAKQKTSEKRQAFSLENVPVAKVKGRTIKHDPNKKLQDRKFIRAALLECIETGDTAAFQQILAAHIKAVGANEIEKQTKIPARTIRNAAKPDSNPTLKTVFAILRAS